MLGGINAKVNVGNKAVNSLISQGIVGSGLKLSGKALKNLGAFAAGKFPDNSSKKVIEFVKKFPETIYEPKKIDKTNDMSVFQEA